jgi:PAS domain S-box-containing protein
MLRHESSSVVSGAATDGGLGSAAGSSGDALKALRDSEERYRAFFRATIDAVLLTAPDGRIFEANEAARVLFGLPDDLTGLDRSMLVDTSDPRLAAALDERARTGRYQAELTLRRLDGSVFEGELSSVVYELADGEPRTSIVVHDISERRRVESALQADEYRLRVATEAAALGLFEHDLETGAVRWEARGLRVDELAVSAPQSFEDVLAVVRSDDRKAVDAAIRRAMTPGQDDTFALDCCLTPAADGSERWMAVYGTVLFEGGRPTRVVGAVQDISEWRHVQVALRESEANLRRAERTGGIGHWTLDSATGAAAWSEEMYRIFGLDPEAFVPDRESFSAMVHPDDRELQRTSLDAAASGAPVVFQHRIVRPDGEVRVLAGTSLATPLSNGTFSLFGVAQDVTERVRAEEEVRRLNRDLERRVAQRTAQLETVNDELEAFSYSVSHDLRAPLRHISGYAGILREELGDGLGAEAARMMDAIQSAVGRMDVLIDRLLQLSRLGRTDLHLGVVAMDELVAEVLRPLREEAAGRTVEVALSPLPPAYGDRTLLSQVWANLLHNAFKYTATCDHGVISVGGWRVDGEVHYSVADNGVGFDMAYADRLFRVFERLHRSEDFEGSGVGLAVVKRIVTRLGGRVWVQAAVDEGATFSFALPASGPDTPED